MLHEALIVALYLGLLPFTFVSPYAGMLLYYWLDWLPPNAVYNDTLLPQNFSLIVGVLTFIIWILREKKTVPQPMLVIALMATYFLWFNVTWYFALDPVDGAFLWNRTIKVVGFAILTAQMLSTRPRLEAFVWVFVLTVIYYSVPSAIKVMVGGGGGGIGTGEVVASEGGMFGDRVTLSVVMSMALPFALYLGRWSMLLPARWQRWVRPAMLGVSVSLLISLIGTFARTAIFDGGAVLLMLAARGRRKVASIVGVAATIGVLLLIAPGNWFGRMDTIAHYQQDGSAMGRISAWKWSWHFALAHPILGGGFGVARLDAGHIYGRPGWLEAHNIFFEVMAEQGFVGLAIFCFLIIAIYRSCAAVQKRVRGREDLAWAANLARATQIALAGFVAGGCFVNIASNPYLFLLGGIAIGTRSLVERELAARLSPARLRVAAPSQDGLSELKPTQSRAIFGSRS
jgi:putative inorganic carbon (hco3(-)) transporter